MIIHQTDANAGYLTYGTQRHKKTEAGSGESTLMNAFSSYRGNDRTVFGKNVDDIVKNEEYTYKTLFNSSSRQNYSTYFTEEGIFCMRSRPNSSRNTLVWQIPFKDNEQADDALDFIKKFPESDELIFSSKEYFWQDFLGGKLDRDSFKEFYDWTDHGHVQINKSDDGQLMSSFNRNKIRDPNAAYFNDNSFVAYAWTYEDIENMQKQRLSSPDLQKYGNDFVDRINHDMDTGRIQSYDPRHLTTKNRYMRFADVDNVISYNGLKFRCNFDNDTMEYGDISDPSKCVKIALSDGGYLLFNIDDLYKLRLATNLFQVEDLQRIQATLSEM
jgi:hypothetical protein